MVAETANGRCAARPLAVAAVVTLSLLAAFAFAMALVYLLLLPVSLPLLAGGAAAGLASYWLARRTRIPTHWYVIGGLGGFVGTWLLLILWWILIHGGGD